MRKAVNNVYQTNISAERFGEDGIKTSSYSPKYNHILSKFTFKNFSYTFELIDSKSEQDIETRSVSGIKLHIGSSIYTIPKPDCSRKQLIYRCAHGIHCFGLADRQRGMRVLFLLAMLTNRTFSISFTKPCPLTNFIIPNFYNWTKCLPSSLREENENELRFVESLPNNSAILDLDTDLWQQDIVILTTNLAIDTKMTSHPAVRYTLPWIPTLSIDRYRHILHHLLFKLSNNLQNQLDTYVKQITENHSKIFVGAHIREAYTQPEEEKNMIEFLKENYANSSNHVIYLATDKAMLRHKLSSSVTNLHTMNVTLKITHVNNELAPCDSLYYAIMEQEILAQSDVLIKTGSGFSESARIIRGPKGIGYYFYKDTISRLTFE